VKVLLFGKSGQVGWELQRSLACLGDLIALDFDSTGLCGDFSDLNGISQTVRTVAPDVIVNAAAYTAVDRAESVPDLANTINAVAPGVLAQEASRIGAWLIHYSTDYVFDGSGTTPWSESDQPNPLNVYGKTKLDGEDAVRRSGCNHLIFRTSWVYAARGNNFAKTMLRLSQERDRLEVIDDQVGAPTGAEMLADATAHAIRATDSNPDVGGLYHLVAGGEASWWEYARFVIDYARLKGAPVTVEQEHIAPVSSQAYQLPAIRPHNSRMNTNKFCDRFGLTLPHWQDGVARLLEEIVWS